MDIPATFEKSHGLKSIVDEPLRPDETRERRRTPSTAIAMLGLRSPPLAEKHNCTMALISLDRKQWITDIEHHRLVSKIEPDESTRHGPEVVHFWLQSLSD
jgi:hypothetical protein